MNTPIAIFGGLALIAAAIYVTGNTQISGIRSAAAQATDSEWALLGHNEPLIIWKLNRKSGELFACTYKAKACELVK